MLACCLCINDGVEITSPRNHQKYHLFLLISNFVSEILDFYDSCTWSRHLVTVLSVNDDKIQLSAMPVVGKKIQLRLVSFN